MPANQYMDAAKAKCHLRRVGMTYQRAKLEVVRQNSGVFSEVFSQTKKWKGVSGAFKRKVGA
jgi:hypothetical protein